MLRGAFASMAGPRKLSMPYFLFELHTQPVRYVRLLQTHASFKPASVAAKALRLSTVLPPGSRIKLMHSETEWQAELLLMEERVDDSNPGDD